MVGEKDMNESVVTLGDQLDRPQVMMFSNDNDTNQTTNPSEINQSKKPKKNPKNKTNKHEPFKFKFYRFFAKLIGEATFAKNAIYSEQNRYERQPYLNKFKTKLASKDEMTKSKDIQMGYGTAILDLEDANFDQLYFMTLWAAGESSSEIINRAAGKAYSYQLENSDNQQQFQLGYLTAVYQFVVAISGPKGDGLSGIIFDINNQLNNLTKNDQIDLTNAWFKQTENYMQGRTPNKFLKSSDVLKTNEDNRRIFTNVRSSLDNGFLSKYLVPSLQQPLMKNITYHGVDYTNRINSEVAKFIQLEDMTLSRSIEHFANNMIPKVINAIGEAGLYHFVYNDLYQFDRNMLGMPITTSTDYDEVFTSVNNNIEELFDRICIPSKINQAAKRLPILDLSHARDSKHEEVHWDYRRKFSFILDKNNNVIFDDMSNPMPVYYGALDLTYRLLFKKMLTPILAEFTMERNRLLSEIKAGNYQTKRDALAPKLDGEDVTVADIANQAARFDIDQVVGLVTKGHDDYQAGVFANSFSEFEHLMQTDPRLKRIRGTNYKKVSKTTRYVYYWLYQSSVADQLPNDQLVKLDNRGEVANGNNPKVVEDLLQEIRHDHVSANVSSDPLITKASLSDILTGQIKQTMKLTAANVENITNIADMVSNLSTDHQTMLADFNTAKADLNQQIKLAKQAAEEAQLLLDSVQPYVNQAVEQDILPVTKTTEILKEKSNRYLQTANGIFYTLVNKI